MPHKHYGASVIHRVLSLLLLVGHSVAAVADPLGRHNRAAFSSWCVRSWLADLNANCNNLRQFGLPRLLDRPVLEPCSCAVILQRLNEAAAGSKSGVFQYCQVQLSSQYPPYGLFRAMLLPGCVT